MQSVAELSSVGVSVDTMRPAPETKRLRAIASKEAGTAAAGARRCRRASELANLRRRVSGKFSKRRPGSYTSGKILGAREL